MEKVDPDPPRLQRVIDTAIKHFLPLGFLFVTIISMASPVPGLWLAQWRAGGYKLVEFCNYCVVFFISGLSLNVVDLKAMSNHLIAFAYGLLSILFLTTVLAMLLKLIPLHPHEYAIGFAIFATVPTTLGVGVALTHASKGNVALSLLLTITSNLLGVITIPLLLSLYVSQSCTINTSDLALKLCINVLIPSICGIFLRAKSKYISQFVTNYKVNLGLVSTFNLIVIVWMAISSTRHILLTGSILQIIYVILIASSMHILYLVLNGIIAIYIIKLSLPEAISVTIMCSQKSSPVALAVISYISVDNSGNSGAYAVPCIIGQLLQIFIGSFVSTYFSTHGTESEKHSTDNVICDKNEKQELEKEFDVTNDGEDKRVFGDGDSLSGDKHIHIYSSNETKRGAHDYHGNGTA
jgi:sodium/bile acid cotransporter 7